MKTLNRERIIEDMNIHYSGISGFHVSQVFGFEDEPAMGHGVTRDAILEYMDQVLGDFLGLLEKVPAITCDPNSLETGEKPCPMD